MFEFLEYSLEHQLANFSECWWDHWILDVIICNGGGTILGIYTLKWLSIKVNKCYFLITNKKLPTLYNRITWNLER